MTPDVNVLVAASREDHVHHAVARRWLLDALGGEASPLRLLPAVIAGFLRVVTSPRVFHQPTPISDAVAFIDALLCSRGVEILGHGHEWPALRDLCLARALTANALPDAWIAATVTTAGEHLVTFDRDFRRLLRRPQLTVLKAG
jgi:toxin-antitoxin system PIN domain toxin